MTTPFIEEMVEKLGNDMSWINKPNYKDWLRQALTEAHQAGRDEALRNVPVGFVRQWINEDLLKEGHRLVTNEDIQRFINIALQDNK